MYDPPVEVKIDKTDYYSIENEVLNVINSAGICRWMRLPDAAILQRGGRHG